VSTGGDALGLVLGASPLSIADARITIQLALEDFHG